MRRLSIWRIGAGDPLLIGEISWQPIRFHYSTAYLSHSSAQAISLSLPLQERPFSEAELMPYFDGLLPEHESRIAIANALHTTPDDFPTILLNCGQEIIGDIAVTETEAPTTTGSYIPLSAEELCCMFEGFSSLAKTNRKSRLSLAGTQGKTGLAHLSGYPYEEGWLQPIGGAASTHVLKVSPLEDIPYLEYLCMKAARTLGIRTPDAELIHAGRPILCVERFDRICHMHDDELWVERLHQEDVAQALGIVASAKYSELSPSTASALAELIRTKSHRPIVDLEEFLKVSLFNYLIGNCDNHLKNLSLLYSKNWSCLELAPAYDLLSTTRYERFSTSMGMDINGKREIGEIGPRDWIAFARSIGVHKSELGVQSKNLVENAVAAFSKAACSHPDTPMLEWLAENLVEEMHARWKVLESVANNV